VLLYLILRWLSFCWIESELSAIVNRGKWLGRPVNIKKALANLTLRWTSRRGTYTHVRFLLLKPGYALALAQSYVDFIFFHWLCKNVVMAMLVLVSCMSIHNHVLYFVSFCAGSTHQNSNKEHATKDFARFPNYFPLSTISLLRINRARDFVCRLQTEAYFGKMAL